MKAKLILSAMLCTFLNFGLVYAEGLTPRPKGGSIESIVIGIINFILKFGFALTVLFIIIGGIMYMTSMGDENKIGVAKKTLTYAIIGLIIIIMSLAIVKFINTTGRGFITG